MTAHNVHSLDSIEETKHWFNHQGNFVTACTETNATGKQAGCAKGAIKYRTRFSIHQILGIIDVLSHNFSSGQSWVLLSKNPAISITVAMLV